MGLFDQVVASDALEDLLDRERKAVLGGRFDVLERLAAEKERLVQTVSRNGTGPNALMRLKSASERNSRLLDAMRAGVAAAQRRVSAMKNQKVSLQTYDAAGRVQAIATAPKKLGHRA
jgi:flagellar biosynthesis/type III secretory pathway chaperone